MPDILTASQLAKRLQVGAETVRRWHRKGLIPALRRLSQWPILFDWEEVRHALKPGKKKASGEAGLL